MAVLITLQASLHIGKPNGLGHCRTPIYSVKCKAVYFEGETTLQSKLVAPSTPGVVKHFKAATPLNIPSFPSDPLENTFIPHQPLLISTIKTQMQLLWGRY